ncbi:MAG: stage V sporulation protein SpoVM [Clostridia bacterium]|nr:stage V sporulation protein SpoVM [Clostridia bacterium]MBR5545051.1 stage V sporulation protein SpoVM [Clostridia bacterium]
MPSVEHRGIIVKVVLIKSPKFLSGILRKAFGIKKTA